ncbi:MAG: hypothetical protein H7646_15995, partial [Candidatus Heimdallarchaeota archaeon]|nr:hypothetical protein [Candidatus Heimdallarchaeota archaeon]
MFFLLICPSCRSLLSYQYASAKDRARKVCIRCKKKFEITKNVTIREFETFKEIHAAHKILSYHLHSDHMTKGSLENILLNFRKLLSEGLSQPDKILEKINGHQASPHDHRDHFTLFGIPLHEVEIDRVHWQTLLSPALYHRLLDNGYTTLKDFGDIRIVDSFGTIFVRTTGQVEGYTDFSYPHRVAQLEGVLAFFKQISGHQDKLLFKIHENEFTVKINGDTELAEIFMKKFNQPKVAFLENKFKTYYDDKGTLRNESYNISDMIVGVEQQYSEQLSKGGISAVVFGNDGNNSGELQTATLLIQQLHQKIDYHTEAITELQKATKELMIHSQDMRRDNELSHEQQRDQGNRIITLLYEK